ncbi:Cut8-domain-containing protein [Neoconidiobolus thromboides FSU 785]|nr:Cut8-domain-containing protein [Neoconidiobolus thromboides FSU 785]
MATHQPVFGAFGTSTSSINQNTFNFASQSTQEVQHAPESNKRSFSPENEDYGRRNNQESISSPVSNNEHFNNTPPAVLRIKGIKKRYRKELVSQKTLTYLLDSLSRDDLLEVVEKVTEANPGLRSDFLAAVPRPTIQSVSFAFSNLEKRVHESFPFNRDGQNRDRYSFTRVRPRLIELRESMIQYADHFFTAEKDMPSMIFNFLRLATDLVHRLPNWDHEADNQFKKECYLKLVEYWNLGIEIASTKMKEGKLFGRALVTDWATDLDRHNSISNGEFVATIYLFQNKLGWVIGIGPMPHSDNFRSFPNHLN